MADKKIEAEAKYLVKVFQFNLESDTKGKGLMQGEIHAASKFGEELERLVEMGAIELVKEVEKAAE